MPTPCTPRPSSRRLGGWLTMNQFVVWDHTGLMTPSSHGSPFNSNPSTFCLTQQKFASASLAEHIRDSTSMTPCAPALITSHTSGTWRPQTTYRPSSWRMLRNALAHFCREYVTPDQMHCLFPIDIHAPGVKLINGAANANPESKDILPSACVNVPVQCEDNGEQPRVRIHIEFSLQRIGHTLAPRHPNRMKDVHG